MAALPRSAASPELREEPGDKRPVAADIIAVRRNGIVQHCAGRIVEIVMFAVPKSPAGRHVAVRIKIVPVVLPEEPFRGGPVPVRMKIPPSRAVTLPSGPECGRGRV